MKSNQFYVNVVARVFFYSGLIWFFGLFLSFPPIGLFMKSAPAIAAPALTKYLGLIILPAAILMLAGQAVKTQRRWYRQIAVSVFIAIAAFIYVLFR